MGEPIRLPDGRIVYGQAQAAVMLNAQEAPQAPTPAKVDAGTAQAGEADVTKVTRAQGANLSGYTVAELRELAKAAGIDGYYRLNKAALVAALEG